jgi:hypothetical protein
MRTITVLAASLWLASVGVIHAQPRMIASWDFDQGAGDVLRDVSGNGHDGRILGATWTEGRFGRGLHFDGQDDCVEVPASPAFDVDDALSLEAWAKLERLGEVQDRVILARADHPVAHGGWGLDWGYGNDFWWGQDGDYRGIARLPAGEWVHLVLVSSLRGYRMTLYVNGALQSRSLWSKPRVASTFPLLIGRRGQGHHFSGWLDGITLYDGTLTAEQVAARYRGEPLSAVSAGAATAARTPPEGAPALPEGSLDFLGAWSQQPTSTPAIYHNLRLALRNRGTEPLKVADVWLDGVHAGGAEVLFAGATTEIVFAGTVPAIIPPGSVGVLNLKLLRGLSLPEPVAVTLQDAGGRVARIHASFTAGPVWFESVAFDAGLGSAWAYLRGGKACELRQVGLAGSDGTVAWQAPVTRVGPGELVPVRLVFPTALVAGTPVVLSAATDAGAGYAFLQAFPARFPVGMYRVQRQTVGADYQPPAGREWLRQYLDTFAVPGKSTGQAPDEWLDDCRRHHIDTLVPDYVDCGGDPAIAARFGFSVVAYGRHAKQYGTHPAISAWYLADEPAEEPVAEVLARCEALRAADPTRPVVVTINPPVWPRAADYDFVDIGYQDTYPVPGAPLSTIAENVAQYVRLLAPKPVVFIPQCFRLAPNRTAGWCRFPMPAEERYMVLLSLAAGARGEVYFAYNVEPFEPVEGCGVSQAPEARALWAEIGRINLELRTLAPLLAQSCIMDTTRDGDVEVARLALGRDAMAVVVLNHDCAYTRETFTPHPRTGLALPVAVPAWLQIRDAFAVTAEGLRPVPYANGTLSLDHPDVGAIVVLTADSALRAQLESRRAELIRAAE